MKSARREAPRKSAQPISFSSHVRSFSTEGGMKYLEVPRRIFQALGGKFMVRLVCTIPQGELEFHCGLMSAGNEQACIFISKEKLKQAGLREGDRVKMALRHDLSKYGMKVPAELSEILKQDQEARRRFEMLSPGKQRNIIFHVASTKNPERRVSRAVQVMADLVEMPEGKESMQVLLNPAAKKGVVITSATQDAEFRSRFLPIEATQIVGTIVSRSARSPALKTASSKRRK